MKHLMKGIRIAAYIAEIIVAGSTIVELATMISAMYAAILIPFIKCFIFLLILIVS